MEKMGKFLVCSINKGKAKLNKQKTHFVKTFFLLFSAFSALELIVHIRFYYVLIHRNPECMHYWIPIKTICTINKYAIFVKYCSFHSFYYAPIYV